MTQQSKIVFVAILVLSLVVVGVIWLVERVNLYTIPTREQEPVTLRVIVAPDLADWVGAMAEDFNQRQSGTIVSVTAVDGARAGSFLDGGTQLIDVWIPEAAFVRYLYPSPPFEASGDSLANETLVWVDPRGGTATDWMSISNAVETDRQFQLALLPRRSIGRLATCASAAAEYTGNGEFSYSEATNRDFQSWMSDIEDAVPNPRRSPFDQLSTRPVTIDLGLILSSQEASLPAGYSRTPPTWQVTLDYPYLVRSRWVELEAETAAAHQKSAAEFQTYLLSRQAQEALQTSGFNVGGQASAEPTGQEVTIDQDVVRGLQWCWE